MFPFPLELLEMERLQSPKVSLINSCSDGLHASTEDRNERSRHPSVESTIRFKFFKVRVCELDPHEPTLVESRDSVKIVACATKDDLISY